MAIKNLLSTSLAITLFSGCTPVIPSPERKIDLSNQSYFSLESPITFENKYERQDGSIAYANYEAPKFKPDTKDILLEIYHPTSSCSPLLTGASEIFSLDATSGSWGKVDFFDQYLSGNGIIDYEGDRPVCAQPGSAEHRYAFCSEKDDRTVIICISQMTDNPELAEEIFSTFRWTE
jgi:hypothetical protein